MYSLTFFALHKVVGGGGGRRLDFCKSKQKRAQTIFLIIFHYPSGWGGEGGLDPFDRMLKKLKMLATKKAREGDVFLMIW